ncbi:heterogeneous nuclear ribonucleoprotein U-like protein 2 [Pangasianodon hypophthalmus]|uniref:heterogeneous nuclear ribonucleoprotein U-like protein 2 n=1 Tax=Pangasianodon hypophthalmus TaxID=310915 RepID=UPI002307FA96|nr:heterogeneous nuclear ribonucleoprotein U-like protein 2 [Pangasianodon hypophthalmus]
MKDTTRDSCDPPDAAAPVLITARDEAAGGDEDEDEDEDVFAEEEEESKEPSDAQQSDGESYGEEIPEEQETRRPDPAQRVAALERATEKDRSSCDAVRSLEETKRAHSTLDEVLQGLLENPEAQRTVRGAAVITDVSAGSDQEAEWTPGPSASAERGICEQLEEKDEELMEECSCSGEDPGEGAATRGTKTNTLISGVRSGQGEDLVAAHHSIWDQPHRRIILEHTPV